VLPSQECETLKRGIVSLRNENERLLREGETKGTSLAHLAFYLHFTSVSFNDMLDDRWQSTVTKRSSEEIQQLHSFLFLQKNRMTPSDVQDRFYCEAFRSGDLDRSFEVLVCHATLWLGDEEQRAWLH
jgi:hypothetical protein